MLKKILKNIHYCITYRPFGDEIDPFVIPCLKNHIFSEIYELPSRPTIAPLRVAKRVIAKFPQSSVCLFIPGTRFDRFGTRHGRGHGWFDRFLAAIPSQWVRIGITDCVRLSPAALPRAPHDEPIDWIICKQKNRWKIIETRARDATQ